MTRDHIATALQTIYAKRQLSDLSSQCPRRRVYMRKKKSIDCMRLGAQTHSFQLRRRVLANNNLLHHYSVNKKMRGPMWDAETKLRESSGVTRVGDTRGGN